jgi:hypothetical protein
MLVIFQGGGVSMKRILFVLGSIIVLLVIGGYTYLKFNPPLISSGITYYEDDIVGVSVEIINNGFADAKLKTVLVDGNINETVELGTSKTGHLILGGNLEEDENISFHKIDEIAIHPKLTIEELNEDSDVVKHYGIRVFTESAPKTVLIKYKYLFLTFELNVDVRRNM